MESVAASTPNVNPDVRGVDEIHAKIAVRA
jgi:hypothetical protein